MTHDARIGTTVAGCRIEATIGQGGMGIVYRAEQLALGRTVALKLLSQELASDPEFRARFQEEARLAASLDHPNVVPIHAAGESEHGELYIVMRHVAGGDLRDLLRAHGGSLPAARATALVAQVGAALDAAHARGLVHRDVKPANVLVGEGERAYLTDFGLSKLAAASGGFTRTGQWLGTIDYCAPEQIEGRRVDARTDVYALGCLLFQLLTGGVPFPRDADVAKVWADVNDPAPALSSIAPGVPGELDAVIAAALAKDPAERYPSAGGFAGAAAAAAAGRSAADAADDRSVATGSAAPAGDSAATAAMPAPRARESTAFDASAPAPTIRRPGPTEPAGATAPRRSPAIALLAALALLLVGGGATAALLAGDGDAGGATEPAVEAETRDADSAPERRSGARSDRAAAPAAASATAARRPRAAEEAPSTSAPATAPAASVPAAPPSEYVGFSGASFAGERPAEWATLAEDRQENEDPPRYRSHWTSGVCGCALVIDVMPGYGRSALDNAGEASGGTVVPAPVGIFDEAALRTASSGDLHTATYYVAYGGANYAIRAEARSPATALAIAERVAGSLLPYGE